ncbi:MAG: prefoldin subunit beta [Nanoarchaeota archaeon]
MRQTDKSIQELQMLEQNLQNSLLQKQSFQMELNESHAALNEIENADDEIYKIIGQLMIKSDKKKIKEELENKKKILELRLKSIDKQEISITEKLEKLREEIMRAVKK